MSKILRGLTEARITGYGPGDPETWPAYSGHPNDPRDPPRRGRQEPDDYDREPYNPMDDYYKKQDAAQAKYNKEVKVEYSDKEGVAPNGERYNSAFVVRASNPYQGDNEIRKFEDLHWGAKKIVDTVKKEPSNAGEPYITAVYYVDNHKYGTWRPWKDEAPTQKPLTFENPVEQFGKVLEGISQEDLANVLCHRIEMRYPDIYKKYDYDAMYNAVDDVASFHAGAEELGSSDINIMIRQVFKRLEESEGLAEGSSSKLSSPFEGGKKTTSITPKHKPLVWENMLGTVMAKDPTLKAEPKYFDYKWDDARAYAKVDQCDDLRICKSPGLYQGWPEKGKMALWGIPRQGVAEGGILKSIKRGLQGWDKNAVGPGGEKLGDPREIVKRAKAMDTDTAKKVRSGLDGASDHSPAGLQKRVLDRKLKGVAEGSGPQEGDEVYYGNRLVGWFKGYSKLGKIITEPNVDEMGDEYLNKDAYWDPQDKITIKPKQGVAEGLEDKTAQQRKTERDKQRTAPAQKARNAAQRKGLTQDKDGTYYAKEGVAEEKGTLWRVHQSEATGRYHVVKGYNKDIKMYKNKMGAGDFNSKESAQAKADELNKGIEEGWKQNLAAAGAAGLMALGGGGAHAGGVTLGGGGHTVDNQIRMNQQMTQQVQQQAPKRDLSGFATEYLQKAADPNRFGRFLVSPEEAKAELAARESGTSSYKEPQKPAPSANNGFSKEYLEKAADPNRFGRYLISIEKAQELLKQMNATNEDQLDELKCWDGYKRVPGTTAGEPGSCEKIKEGDLNELSTDRLAKYKTASAADARAADKAGDFARGNKRFAGIVKATKKQFDNETKPKKESAIMKGLVDENLGTPYPGTYEQEFGPFKRKGSERTMKLTTEGKKNVSRRT